MAERALGSAGIDGNFGDTFPQGATIQSLKTGKSTFSEGNFGIATVDGKLYSIPTTATNILLEAVSSGEVNLPAKIRLVTKKGKGKYAYTVPVVVE